ncbi:PAM68 family protein [Chrysosporum ovalisporum ANA283AFssAo]|uniref:PAM68 family protein n=1 Tax=Umezakia ovalisporum TaxID=75695 RepID=UPI0024763C01|nr:PAM68 family protein [Umezakia ovalisporum]MDH6078529.1 PAM68 family protein [Umezakia ovalisporum FSS-45]MDH6100925.1 PAM68 family protein [Umezakia ovalisporum ANA283AFssAo]
MSAEESERSPLPFERKTKRQKPPKAISKPQSQPKTSGKEASKQPPFGKEEMAIPQAVSQRMIRRVAGFCGIPTALGITTLVVSYLLTMYSDIKLPPIAVLLANMGLFGLGVVGITYGVLSASWDEERMGSLLGLSEFMTNWGRMVEVWRETRQKKL